MPTTLSLIDQLRHARRVSVPLVAINTPDARATLTKIATQLPNGSPVPMVHWNLAEGCKVTLNNPESFLVAGRLDMPCLTCGGLGVAVTTDGNQRSCPTCKGFGVSNKEPPPPPMTAGKPETLFPRLLTQGLMPSGTIFFVINADVFLDDSARSPNLLVRQCVASLRDLFKADGRMLVFLQPDLVLPQVLANDFVVLEEPLPDAEQLAEIVNNQDLAASLCRECLGKGVVEEPDSERPRKTRTVKCKACVKTPGINPKRPRTNEATLQRAVEAVAGLSAFSAEQTVAMALRADGIDLEHAWAKKKSTIEQTKGLSVHRNEASFENLGGLEQIKTYLRRIMTGRRPPRVIAWIDEIATTGLAAREDLSGVNADQEGTLLSWMEDHGVFGLLLTGAPGTGKCLGRGTHVLKYNGTVVPVEFIHPGDVLMGPDSKPRRVLSTTKGTGRLYRVTPVKGEPYVVNEHHILSLKRSGVRNGVRNQIHDISVTDYIAKGHTTRERLKGWRTGVEFQKQDIPLNPYILGLWLGDGTAKGPDFTTADPEIEDAIRVFSERAGLKVSISGVRGNAKVLRVSTKRRGHSNFNRNTLTNCLKSIGVWGHKHIPHIYLATDRDARMQLLAGIIDTDGHLTSGCYDIMQKSQRLANDIVFLARSLGFAAYVTACKKTCFNSPTKARNTYYRVSISGNLSEIPVRLARKKAPLRRQCKDVLVTGITVSRIEDGEYFGFELDGDGRFLLGDFTVTHNSQMAKAVGGEFDRLVVRVDLSAMQGSLVGQSAAQLRQALRVIEAVGGECPMFLATANDIGGLSAPMRSRYTDVFFFDLPTREERLPIWKVWMNKLGLDDEPFDDDDGWVGRNIRQCVEKAWMMDIPIAEAATYINPVGTTDREVIEQMRTQADGRYLSATSAGVYKRPATTSAKTTALGVSDGRTTRRVAVE